jgi:signal transduction histidine kinase
VWRCVPLTLPVRTLCFEHASHREYPGGVPWRPADVPVSLPAERGGGMSRRRSFELGRPLAPSRLNTLSIKTALLTGFGLTVGVWLFAGLYFGGRIADLDARTDEVRDRYVHAQGLLTTARTQVLLSSVHLRDALLDSDPASAEATREAMSAALTQAADSLEQYVPILNSPDEQARVQRLLTEIQELRQTMFEMLDTDSARWSEMAGPFLRGRLTPRRQAFMNVAEELGTLNRTSFVEHQMQVVGLYRETQTRVWQVLGLALALSLGIAVLSTWYAGRLERQVKDQHARDIEMQRGLQRLSAELIRVREEERRTIARELHDEVGQSLTAIKFELAAAQNAVDEHGGPANLLGDVRPIVEHTLQTVRDLSHMLHPAVLDDLGLSAAVDLHVKEFRRRHAISVELTETGMEERLPREVETVAYRIVQEALTNVAKHAKASSCRVSLVQLARSLVVVVGDDGVGFDQGGEAVTGHERGLGLVSMSERAMRLGGSLVIESGPGLGTRIVVELPVVEENEPALAAG